MTTVSRADLLAALAFATDLGTDQPPEHALRVCLVAMRVGEECGVGGDDLWPVAHHYWRFRDGKVEFVRSAEDTAQVAAALRSP
jgi:hypothetical protein